MKKAASMSPGMLLLLVSLGLLAGFASSLVGIGGGLIIVPGLVFLFGFDQKMAQGTSLLLLSLPVAAAGAFTYYKTGNASWPAALLLGVGFLAGGFLGGKVATGLDTAVMKKVFAIFMILIAIKYLFFDGKKAVSVPAENAVLESEKTADP
jgi:uncharacterized membrane protein YfcA